MSKKIKSVPGFFGSTTHYDAKGHKIGSSVGGGVKTDHYINGKYAGSSYDGGFKTDHYDRSGKSVGSSYKGWFGTTDTEIKKKK